MLQLFLLFSLNENDKIVFAYNELNVVAGSLSNTYLASLDAKFTADKTKITSLPAEALIYDVKKQGNYYTFTNNNKLLGTTGTKKIEIILQ